MITIKSINDYKESINQELKNRTGYYIKNKALLHNILIKITIISSEYIITGMFDLRIHKYCRIITTRKSINTYFENLKKLNKYYNHFNKFNPLHHSYSIHKKIHKP